jgi:hypothetical protein
MKQVSANCLLPAWRAASTNGSCQCRGVVSRMARQVASGRQLTICRRPAVTHPSTTGPAVALVVLANQAQWSCLLFIRSGVGQILSSRRRASSGARIGRNTPTLRIVMELNADGC